MSKVTQRTARVRFTDYREQPIGINLLIYSSGAGWEMAINALGQTRDRIFIDITSKYLGELNVMLREEAGKVLHHAQIGGSFAKEQLKIDVAELAKAGNFVFREIFKQEKALNTIMKLFSYAQEHANDITIEISSANFFIPWELLYSDSLEKPRYENFWGMKYIISRVINQNDRPGDIEPTTIYVDSKPKLGLLALENNSLPSIVKKEIPFFEQLKKNGKISLRKLPSLDPTPANKDSELHKFKKFLNTPFDVAHFACHAQYDKEKSLKSFIELSKGIRISLRDLAQQPPVAIRDFPLIVLNACKMGAINPMDVHHFAGDFIRYGALGVIATETAVPDSLAADFTLHLYEHLLNEKFLGESVLLTRQELLKRGNPVGLLYALYAPPIIKLQLPRGKKNASTRKTKATSTA